MFRSETFNPAGRPKDIEGGSLVCCVYYCLSGQHNESMNVVKMKENTDHEILLLILNSDRHCSCLNLPTDYLVHSRARSVHMLGTFTCLVHSRARSIHVLGPFTCLVHSRARSIHVLGPFTCLALHVLGPFTFSVHSRARSIHVLGPFAYSVHSRAWYVHVLGPFTCSVHSRAWYVHVPGSCTCSVHSRVVRLHIFLEVYAMDRLKDSTKQPLTPAEYRRLKP